MRLGSRGGGGARVCMRWDGWGGVRGGRSESEWVGIGRNRGFSDTTIPLFVNTKSSPPSEEGNSIASSSFCIVCKCQEPRPELF